MLKNYMIAICDILGFTRLVQKNSVEQIVENSLGWLRKSLHHSIHKLDFPSDVPSLKQLQDHPNVGLAWFSDTILLYTREDTEECIRSLLSGVGWLLFETMLTPDVRLRCGISYGESYIDPEESVYVGHPIIDAYQLEEKQAWAGGALTKAAVQRLPDSARSGYFPEWFVIPYPVPLSNQTTMDTLAINWTIGVHLPGFDFRWSRTKSIPSSEDWASNPRICEKWQNTRNFHNSVCRFCASGVSH